MRIYDNSSSSPDERAALGDDFITAASDDTYGGRFLEQSALEVSRKRVGAEAGQGCGPRFDTTWRNLVAEVMDQYQTEREILTHTLAIKEYRPRTFFSVLPEMQEWRRVDAGLKDFEVAFRTLNQRSRDDDTAAERRLSILIPIHNGYRRTFRSLACLCFDADALQRRYDVDIHVFVNFSDDNSLYEVLRFATTLARSRALPVTIYSAEDKKRRGSEGRQGRWWKTVAVNVMLQRILDIVKNEHYHEGRYYLHFADDDIFIEPGRRVIERNIEELDEKKPKIVSGCYSSDETVGFSMLTSVRKRPQFIQGRPEEGQLLNLYGGCMTTTLENLRKVVGAAAEDPIRLPSLQEKQEFGEDSYLTIAANLDMLLAGTSEVERPRKLEGYAIRDNLVEHREATNPVDAARRLLRDTEWCPQAAEAALRAMHRNGDAEALATRFLDLRRETFDTVTRAVEEGGDLRQKLAQWWWREYRDRVRAVEGGFDAIAGMRGLDWTSHKTQHQICREVYEDEGVLKAIRYQLSIGPFGREVMKAADDCLKHGDRPFAELCRLLAARPYNSVKEALVGNAHLYHLYNIAMEAVCYSEQFLCHAGEASATGGAPGGLLKYYPLRLGEVLREAFPDRFRVAPSVGVAGNGDDRGMVRYDCTSVSSSPLSYNLFLTRRREADDEKDPEFDSLFLRYYSVIGRSRFHEDSPRRLVYLHTLGENIVRRILKRTREALHDPGSLAQGDGASIPDLNILQTRYPTLKLALVNYAGPEQRSPFARFMQAIYIQESMQNRGKPVSHTVLWDSQCAQLAGCAGRFLGRMHGASLGLRRVLELIYLGKRKVEGSTRKEMRGVVRILVAHLDQVRLFNPSAYRRWLREGTRQGRALGGIADVVKEPGMIGDRVERLIRQDGIHVGEVWQEMCRESEEFHQAEGSMGHLGFTARNLFIDQSIDGFESRVLRHPRPKMLVARKSTRIERVWLASHFSVAMVDPAIEAGLTLADLVSWRLCSNVLMRQLDEELFEQMDDTSLRRIVDRFSQVYLDVLKRASNLSPLKQLANADQERLINRINKFAAIALIHRFHASEEYELTEEERVQLVHICVDLLQMGNTLRLRFRESRRPRNSMSDRVDR